MSTKRYISLVVLLSLVFSALFFYFRIGGFTKKDISVVSSEGYLVAGKSFKGRVKEKEFGQLFRDADTLLRAQREFGSKSGRLVSAVPV